MRQELIHQRYEAVVVSGLHQVDHFVHDDVLEALRRLFGQIRIQPDAPELGPAASPFRFHPLRKESLHLYANDRLPFADQGGNCLLELLAIPFFENGLLLFFARTRTDLQVHLVVLEFHGGCLIGFDHLRRYRFPQT